MMISNKMILKTDPAESQLVIFLQFENLPFIKTLECFFLKHILKHSRLELNQIICAVASTVHYNQTVKNGYLNYTSLFSLNAVFFFYIYYSVHKSKAHNINTYAKYIFWRFPQHRVMLNSGATGVVSFSMSPW